MKQYTSTKHSLKIHWGDRIFQFKNGVLNLETDADIALFDDFLKNGHPSGRSMVRTISLDRAKEIIEAHRTGMRGTVGHGPMTAASRAKAIDRVRQQQLTEDMQRQGVKRVETAEELLAKQSGQNEPSIVTFGEGAQAGVSGLADTGQELTAEVQPVEIAPRNAGTATERPTDRASETTPAGTTLAPAPVVFKL